MSMQHLNIEIPYVAPSYPAGGCQFTVDKTGTLFFLHVGRLVDGGPWGYRLYRVKPNSKEELLWFGENCTANMTIIDNELYLGYTTDKWVQKNTPPIAGYIGWGNQPSGTVVNVDETALDAVKASINTINIIANAANAKAQRAQDDATALYGTVKTLEAKVYQLQSQVNQLQSQVSGMLTPSQIADLVWSKIKDTNYLYRLAFNLWPVNSTDPDIRAYVSDLVSLIKRVKS